MKKILGIFLLLVVVCVGTAALNSKFLDAYNLQNIVRWTSLFAKYQHRGGICDHDGRD